MTIAGAPTKDAPEVTEDLTQAIDTSTMTPAEIAARNMRVVEAHFHNENPDDVDKAIALYTDDVVWEGPVRGRVYTDHAAVKAAYLDIFRDAAAEQGDDAAPLRDRAVRLRRPDRRRDRGGRQDAEPRVRRG